MLLTLRATHHQSYKTIQDLQDPQEPSRLKNSKSVQGRVVLIRHQSRETLVVAGHVQGKCLRCVWCVRGVDEVVVTHRWTFIIN